jgi:methionine-rich copper-binding protein CopC
MSNRAKIRAAVPLLIATFLVAILGALPVSANATPQPLPFSQDWSNTGLITADNNWNSVPGVVGFIGNNLTRTEGTDPQTILVGGDMVGVLANQTNPGTVLQGGVAEFEDGNPVVAIKGFTSAPAPNIVITLNTTGKTNVFVSYNLRDIDDSSANAVQPVAVQYRVGNTGTFTNLPAGFVDDATAGPNQAGLVTPVEVGLPAAANDQAIVQVRIITANAVGPDEWVGIDDISAIASLDDPPVVQSTIPANGATDVPIGSNLSVTFSEPVNLAAGWFSISCASSGAHGAAVSGGPTTWTLNPTTPFEHSENCTLRVKARSVTDQDTIDPPDRMALDKAVTFRTIPPDDAPTVTGTAPVDGATNVPVGDNLGVAFSEPVDVASGAFTVSCSTTGAHAVTVSGGPTSFTIDPAANFGFAETCTLTVHGAMVTDQDTNDPPDAVAGDTVVSFTTPPPPDAAPTVTATTPADGAVDVTIGANLDVTFSEPVDVAAGWYALDCVTSGAHTATVSGGPTVFTIDPDTDLANSESCTLTVHAAQVTDQDTNDPPDAMAQDVTATFTTLPPDAAPTVTGTSPADGATGVAVNSTVSVTFSEPVNVAGGWFTIGCGTSGAHTAAVSGGPTTWTLDPDTDFTNGESCTLTVHGAQVTDQDANDPPDAMVADATASFTTPAPPPDLAPTVTGTSPADQAVGVPVNSNVTVTFSEPVDVAAGWSSIVCTTSGSHAVAVTGGPTIWTLDPSADFATSEGCTLTINAAQVTDQDTNDPPDAMAANVTSSFTTAAGAPPVNRPPTVSAGGPYAVEQGATVQVSATGTDPEGQAITYAWDLDGNGTFETAGQTVTFSAAGIVAPASRTISVRGTDPGGLADTSTATVSITWHNGGFGPPIGGNTGPITQKAGSNIPVKFSLGGNHGLNIMRAGYPASAAYTCGGTLPTDATEAIPSPNLKYDAATDTYSFQWKTDKAWSGTCRVLVVGLRDGTNLSVGFDFR